MGDRVSISFKNDNKESVVLFSHWRGMNLVKQAKQYVAELKEECKQKGILYPLYRLEVDTVMVDFVRHITKGMERVNSDLYLTTNNNRGDNSDNGHHVINLTKTKKYEVIVNCNLCLEVEAQNKEEAKQRAADYELPEEYVGDSYELIRIDQCDDC